MSKLKKCVLYVLIATMVLSFGVLSFTTAKYIRNLGNSGSNIGDTGDIPFALLEKIDVTSQEDLFNALEKGYPYIKLSERVRDPLIVTQSTMDVQKSLVLDLNGKRLERIGTKALLTVPANVTLTIIDSSKEATGGLYNPVGTVLHVSGGSLNVRGGKFESGPRTWEYYSASKEDHFPTNFATENESTVIYSDATNKDVGGEDRLMPIIKPTIVEEGGIVKSVDGNIYFDKPYEKNGTVLIPADTYCFYVTSDSFTAGTTVSFDKSTADFSYTYYANDSYEYIPTSKNDAKPEGSVEVTIYGFKKNIQKAMGQADYDDKGGTDPFTVDKGVLDYNIPANVEKIPWYAAVNMEAGKLDVDCENISTNVNSSSSTGTDTKEGTSLAEGGTTPLKKVPDTSNYKEEFDYKSFGKGSFISYFGVETTSCVQFTGGEMKVTTDGVFATVNPKTISSINPNALSSEGRSVVIHNNGSSKNDDNGNLTINGGTFLTYNMSVVRLMAGHCTVNNSMFYRVQNTHYYAEGVNHPFGTGTIYTAGGDIEVYGTEFWISSIKTLAEMEQEQQQQQQQGKERVSDYEGAYGIYSVAGNITARDIVIYADGDCCRGIYSNPYQYIEERSSTGGTSGIVGGKVDLYNALVYVSGDQTFGIYSRGGTVSVDAKEHFNDPVNGLTFNSRFFIEGNKTMCIYANLRPPVNGVDTPATQDTSEAVIMNRTRIRVNESHKNVNGDFNVAINSVDANLSFNDVRIESRAYGVTCLNGSIKINDSFISTKEAPGIIVKGDPSVPSSGKITALGKIDIDSYVKEAYVNNVQNIWEGYLDDGDTKNYLRTHSAIDIQGGFLDVDLDEDKNPDDEFNVTFDTDIVTPETKDRIGDKAENGSITNIPYVVNGKDETTKKEIHSEIFDKDSGQMIAAAAMLPPPMSAIRVAGGKGQDALTIISTSNIIAKRGAGIIIRGGNVTLGKEDVSQEIKIQAQADSDLNNDGVVNDSDFDLDGDGVVEKEDCDKINSVPYYGTDFKFNGKSNWLYHDSKYGGDAMYVSGGSVTSYADNLTLNAAHGNGLFVTGANIVPDSDFRYKGVVTIADGTESNPTPTVTINAGTFIGNAHPKMVTGNESWFFFTGPSSHYGVKVVSGGSAEINGGTFSGYGAVCTMGAVTTKPIQANLTINGDSNDTSKHITMYGKRDVACFYNASNVKIKSIDKDGIRIKSASEDKGACEDLNDFGVAIPDGENTAIVIEAHGASTGTDVYIDGGYYRAIAGDQNGAKAIWASNPSATLTIDGGYFIGNNKDGNGGHGGAIQQQNEGTALKEINLNGGYFINYNGGNAFTGYVDESKIHIGANKMYYLEKIDNYEYFAEYKTDGSREQVNNIWGTAVYIPYKQIQPRQ